MKPTIVIVPGSWSGPEHYATVKLLLEKQEYEVVVGTLQSANRQPPQKPAGLYEDATYFRGMIDLLASQGKEIVIIGHSYGGLVATETLEGTSKSEREAKGLTGGIVKIIYVAVPMGDVGQSLIEARGGQFGIVSVMGDYMHLPKEAANGLNFGIPEEAQKIRIQSTRSFLQPTTIHAVDYVPVVYLVTPGDVVVPEELQNAAIQFMRNRKPGRVSVAEVDGGHMLNLIAPESFAKGIISSL